MLSSLTLSKSPTKTSLLTRSSSVSGSLSVAPTLSLSLTVSLQSTRTLIAGVDPIVFVLKFFHIAMDNLRNNEHESQQC